MLYHNDFSTLL